MLALGAEKEKLPVQSPKIRQIVVHGRRLDPPHEFPVGGRGAVHLPVLPLGDGGDQPVGPQSEPRVVVHKQVEIVGEPVLEIAARRRGPAGQVEPRRRLAERRDGPGLTLEAGPQLGVGGDLRRENLDRDGAVEARARPDGATS